jgi:NAD(P)-dependent dehydrogenase (short-subunit alcohol dehydrogenase family)
MVTGAGRRVGRAIAIDLAMHGWDIAVHYRSSHQEAEEAVREIRALGRRAEAVGADLGDAGQTDGLIAAACDAVGPLDLLVNSASLFEPDTAHDLTAAGFDRHFGVNLRAPLQLARDFAAQGGSAPGRNVINIVDQRVWRLTPHYMTYTASKYALWGVTRTLAQALAPAIRVNAIGPGPTLAHQRQSAAEFAVEAGGTPLQRSPSLAEFGAAVRFIVATPSMTGQMIALDGGQHLAWRTPDVIAGDGRSS